MRAAGLGHHGTIVAQRGRQDGAVVARIVATGARMEAEMARHHRRLGELAATRRELVGDLTARGWSMQRIATACGLSKQRVAQLLRQYK